MDTPNNEPKDNSMSEWMDSPEFAAQFNEAMEKDGALPPKADDIAPAPEPKPDPAPRPDPAPSPEPKPASDDDPPSHIKGAAADSWRKLKESHKAEMTTLQQQLEELRQKAEQPQLPPDYEQLKTQAKEYSDRLKLLDIQQHPEFKAKFDGGREKVVKSALSLTPSEQHETVKRILDPSTSLREKETLLDDIRDNLGSMGTRRVERAIDELVNLDLERQEALETARANYEQYQNTLAQTQREQEQQASELFNQTLEKVMRDNPLFQAREGDDEWNSNVKESVDIARQLYNGKLTPQQAAEFSLNAGRFPSVLKQNLAQATVIEQLNARIKELEGTRPDPSGGRAPSSTPSSQDDDYKPKGDEHYQDDLSRRAAEALGNRW